MSIFSVKNTIIAFGCCAIFFSTPALAIRLEVSPDANWAVHVGSAILLYLHIGGGALGIVSGLLASLTVKGSALHRKAGVVFLWAMFICYVIGALVAPFLNSQQSTNFVAGILALYLLLSGVSASRRRRFVAGTPEKVGLIVALLITSIGMIFMVLAASSPDGSMDGSPPQAYVLFIAAGGAALCGEIMALYKRVLSPTARVIRHLWRMSMSFFIASGSAFFGQAEFFPVWFNDSLFPLLLGFFPILVLILYVGKFAVKALLKRRQTASPPT